MKIRASDPTNRPTTERELQVDRYETIKLVLKDGMEIAIAENEYGKLELRVTEGQLIVIPKVANIIEIKPVAWSADSLREELGL